MGNFISNKLFLMFIFVVVVVATYYGVERTIFRLSRRYWRKESFVRIVGMVVELFVLCCMVIYLLWVSGVFVVGVDVNNRYEDIGYGIEYTVDSEDVGSEYNYIVIE